MILLIRFYLVFQSATLLGIMFWPILEDTAMFGAAPCMVHAFVIYLIVDKTWICFKRVYVCQI